MDYFIYLASNISSTESDVNIHMGKRWISIDMSTIIWKSDLSDNIVWEFFQVVAVSVLLYGCTTWTQTKVLEKKLDGKYIRMLYTVLKNSSMKYPTKRQLYGHLPLLAGGSRGVMVIVVGNGHGDSSSNPGWEWLHFHIALIPLGKVWIQLFSLQLWVNSRTDWFLQPWWGN